MYNHKLMVGRFFNWGEVQGRRRVAVLGANVPAQLGQEADTTALLGQTIQLRGVPFTVVGILQIKGDAAFMRPDDQIFIPQSTAQYRVFGGRDRMGSIYASTATPEQLEQAYEVIDRVMRREHKIEPGAEADFTVRNSTDLLETFNETTQTFTMLLAGIAGISLLVGGIGIMNIMLVSVTERTREIGVRKALGATRRAILFQFLIESLFLCVLGGLLGVATGIGGAMLLTRIQQWQTAISAGAIFMALGFSAAVGLFFGIWPAQRAARLDPIVALRYE
jgi:putative ABC transport system permease protein